MQKIITLPPHEARKIAAGQVVDRPANVVKELVENALDAGATSIIVTIHEAGQALIRVVDNGHGMSDDDALKCFEHHATSKIRCFDDVAQLSTYGFRGEALASIAAVSSITLLTKQEEDAQGICVTGNAHDGFKKEPTTCTRGTDISVHSLFYNVPVRKKFLKKDETEMRAITMLMHAFALTHTHVHFQLHTEHSLVLNCPKATTLSDRVAQIWDHALAHNLVALAQDSSTDVAITGLISNQQLTRYNRNHMFFFVNKRWVKNYQIAQALLKGYAPTLQHGRFPVAFLFLEVPAHEVDINIHPRKEEVAFVHPVRIEKALFNAVQHTLKISFTKALEPSVLHASSPSPQFLARTPHIERTFQEIQQPSPSFFLPSSAQIARQQFENNARAHEHAPEMQEIQMPLVSPAKSEQEIITYDVIGIFHNTYIMVAQADGILMVDQHAVHERILYERISKQTYAPESTSLLFPEVIPFLHEDFKLLLPHVPLLENHGIRVEPFGDTQLIVQATPIQLKMISWRDFFTAILEILKEESTNDSAAHLESLTHKLRATMACKAAVKAGDILAEPLVQKLLNDFHHCERAFSCPHGRPTTWFLPLSDIEKKFKRRM